MWATLFYLWASIWVVGFGMLIGCFAEGLDKSSAPWAFFGPLKRHGPLIVTAIWTLVGLSLWSPLGALSVLLFIGQWLGSHVKVIGLTGGIASGKSTVSNQLKSMGIPIIDADLIARQVVEVDKPAYRKIVNHFGAEILLPDRSIDRAKLGDIVFRDDGKRHLLNSFVHQIFTQILKYRFLYQKRLVVLDAPLLLESKALPYLCYPIVVVHCSNAQQLERLVSRNNLTPEQARDRILSQLPLEAKAKRADLIISNSHGLKELEEETLKVIAAIGIKAGCEREVQPLLEKHRKQS